VRRVGRTTGEQTDQGDARNEAQPAHRGPPGTGEWTRCIDVGLGKANGGHIGESMLRHQSSLRRGAALGGR
jgi:hypothetical protein